MMNEEMVISDLQGECEQVEAEDLPEVGAVYDYRSGWWVEVPAQLGWAYGSGKPNGTRLATQIDKAAGDEQFTHVIMPMHVN